MADSRPDVLDVPLRDYRTGNLSNTKGRAPRDFRGSAAVASFVILLTAVGLLYWKNRSLVTPTDPVTLCLKDKPPSSLTVVLLDVSDRFSQPQKLEVTNQLSRVRDKVPRFGLIEFYALDRAGARLPEAVFHKCNPGSGTDMSELYQNPRLARRKWAEFADTLASVLNSEMNAVSASRSPIFEAIQSIALRSLGNPNYDRLEKKLVIVSDLLQNEPGGLNMYKQVPEFASFENTAEFSRVRSDLAGVDVQVFYLARPDVHTQGRAHIGFWDRFFRAQGATLKSVDKVYGDL